MVLVDRKTNLRYLAQREREEASSPVASQRYLESEVFQDGQNVLALWSFGNF